MSPRRPARKKERTMLNIFFSGMMIGGLLGFCLNSLYWRRLLRWSERNFPPADWAKDANPRSLEIARGIVSGFAEFLRTGRSA